ncbi:MAG TPA: glycoside hydrolase family 16 protein, partial [Hymenobacter sp.]|nr:glycoside hydrolase family 16 protein [Hymenobacter sp.]
YRDMADMAVNGPWQFTPSPYRTLIGNQYEDEYYDSTAVELHNGDLHLVARPLPEPLLYHYQTNGRDTSKLLHYRSGWIALKKDFPTNPALGDTARWPGNIGFQHGLFEIRCKLSPGSGLWPAFWLYSGPTEIDVLEGYGARKASNNVIYVPKPPEKTQSLQDIYDYTQPIDLTQDFHTYSAIWTATEVSFYLDRQLLRTVPVTLVPTYPGPVTVIANQAVLSEANPNTWLGPPGQKHAPLIIDYIKVYKPRTAQIIRATRKSSIVRKNRK